ncbi:MAG TPA: FtsQ-type POTRA domain-containing protein [bacterium]|nr:FtsQ-type POTRA domain-containing protein [bacterium]
MSKTIIIKVITTIALIALMLATIFIVMRKNGVFQLKAAKIYNNHYVTADEIAAAAGFDFSQDIFEIKLKQLENRISAHPLIDRVKINRSLPSVLNVEVLEHNIIAGVAGSEIAALSDGGILIDDYPTETVYDVPIITGVIFHTDSSGNRILKNQPELDQILKIIKAIRDIDPLLYDEISEWHCSESHGAIIYLKRNNVPVILGQADKVSQLNYLATIFYHFYGQKNFDQIQAIDLRFRGQVVIKQKS